MEERGERRHGDAGLIDKNLFENNISASIIFLAMEL
jgi:hypothetical protein